MKKKRDKIFFWICSIICIFCVAYIGYYYVQKAESKKDYKEVKKKVVKDTGPARGPAPASSQPHTSSWPSAQQFRSNVQRSIQVYSFTPLPVSPM